MAKKLTIEHFRVAAGFKPYSSLLEVRDKDDDYGYRWVDNTPESIRYRGELGYEVVTDAKDASVKTKGSGAQTDTARRISHELILMRRPVEYEHMAAKARDEKALQKMRGPIDRFKAQAKRLGVEVVDETKIEIGPLVGVLDSDEEDDDA